MARLESIRLLLAIATHCSWEVHHMDVKSFFLNGELKETIDVQQPPGFLDNNNPYKVLRMQYPTVPYCRVLQASTTSLEREARQYPTITEVQALCL